MIIRDGQNGHRSRLRLDYLCVQLFILCGIGVWNGLVSELKKERRWRTREDPFGEVWDAVQRQIQESPGLEAKTLFEWLQREYPARFSDGQIRTLQRRDQNMAGESGTGAPQRRIGFRFTLILNKLP
jgi:hypothetical protein